MIGLVIALLHYRMERGEGEILRLVEELTRIMLILLESDQNAVLKIEKALQAAKARGAPKESALARIFSL